MVNWHNLLRLLLKAETTVLHVAKNSFRKSYDEREVVVNSARLILLEQGTIQYFAESSRFKIEAPTMIFVPPWIRRSWKVLSPKGCLLRWCEFSPNIFAPSLHRILVKRDADWPLEQASLRRMAQSWTGERLASQPPEEALLLQGEIKACLARFFAGKGDLWTGGRTSAQLSSQWITEITGAQLWLEQNFARPDALSEIKKLISHDNASFRRFFRIHCGFTPTSYLQALRMRYARYLLCESGHSVKEVASEVGYRDPLYFSKQYHCFWGYPPKNERSLRLPPLVDGRTETRKKTKEVAS